MDNHKIAEVLNDLVQINNDRLAGYENAVAQLEEGYNNLEDLFQKMMKESQVYNQQLIEEINKLGEETAQGTSGAGKVYRTWMDVKALFTSGDAGPILNTCETIENATQRAYEDALDEEGLTAEVHVLITKQKAMLLDSHNQIKQLLAIAKQ